MVITGAAPCGQSVPVLARSQLSRGADGGSRSHLAGRSRRDLFRARASLLADTGCSPSAIVAVPCDVRSPGDVDSLCTTASSTLGNVDLFFCNAASSGSLKQLAEQSPETLLAGER